MAAIDSNIRKPFSPTILLEFPLDLWHSDFSDYGISSEAIDEFFDVLRGKKPDGSLYRQAAASLLILKQNDPMPGLLWRAFFRVLNAYSKGDIFVSEPLAALAQKKWLHAITNQRFAFSTPSVFCPIIEEACRNPEFSGLAKVAVILESAIQPLGITFEGNAREMLRKIRLYGVDK